MMLVIGTLCIVAGLIILGFAIVTDPYVEHRYGKTHSEDTQ